MPFSSAPAFAVPLYAISKPRGGSIQPFSICNWHVMAIRHVQVKQSPCSLKVVIYDECVMHGGGNTKIQYCFPLLNKLEYCFYSQSHQNRSWAREAEGLGEGHSFNGQPKTSDPIDRVRAKTDTILYHGS